MKKLILAILLLSTNAYADTISLGTISADATATGFNSNFQGIANVLNGNVEGSCDGGVSACNMKADSIYRINMADDADPATFAKETLQITVDTTSSEGSFTASGCTPADDTDLTSDISACISYVNGIRVSKSATANTYTASRDCYVDLSQTGVYTTSCVTNGAAEPSVAANSARLAKVVTDGTEITTITDLANRAVPGLLVPTNFRSGMAISQDSTTVIKVYPGNIEVNETMLSKTSTTSLTISTAGDWAGGSSLRATNTTAFVGIDASGNLKMHTTAPTHDNYALSSTDGKKRYASWSSTTYRVIGWFRMNATGSGELDSYGVSNISDESVRNIVRFSDSVTATTTTVMPFDNTIPQNTEGGQFLSVNFRPTSLYSKIRIRVVAQIGNRSAVVCYALFQDSTANALTAGHAQGETTTNVGQFYVLDYMMQSNTTSLTTFKFRAGPSGAGTIDFNGDNGVQIFGGVANSFIEVEEIN